MNICSFDDRLATGSLHSYYLHCCHCACTESDFAPVDCLKRDVDKLRFRKSFIPPLLIVLDSFFYFFFFTSLSRSSLFLLIYIAGTSIAYS